MVRIHATKKQQVHQLQETIDVSIREWNRPALRGYGDINVESINIAVMRHELMQLVDP